MSQLPTERPDRETDDGQTVHDNETLTLATSPGSPHHRIRSKLPRTVRTWSMTTGSRNLPISNSEQPDKAKYDPQSNHRDALLQPPRPETCIGTHLKPFPGVFTIKLSDPSACPEDQPRVS